MRAIDDPTLLKELHAYISQGAAVDTVIKGCKLTKAVWDEWMQKGETDYEQSKEAEELSNYAKFYLYVNEEYAKTIRKDLKILRNPKQFKLHRAAMFRLERIHPKAYADLRSLRYADLDKKPIESDGLKSTPEQLIGQLLGYLSDKNLLLQLVQKDKDGQLTRALQFAIQCRKNIEQNREPAGEVLEDQ